MLTARSAQRANCVCARARVCHSHARQGAKLLANMSLAHLRLKEWHAALQHGRSKKDSKSGDKGAGGGGEDQLSAMPSFTRAGSSFTRRRADTASALSSPRGGIESYSMPSMPEDRVVASTRTSFAVGGGGSAPTTPRGGASGGRTRQESKGGFGWPFGKKE